MCVCLCVSVSVCVCVCNYTLHLQPLFYNEMRHGTTSYVSRKWIVMAQRNIPQISPFRVSNYPFWDRYGLSTVDTSEQQRRTFQHQYGYIQYFVSCSVSWSIRHPANGSSNRQQHQRTFALIGWVRFEKRSHWLPQDYWSMIVLFGRCPGDVGKDQLSNRTLACFYHICDQLHDRAAIVAGVWYMCKYV